MSFQIDFPAQPRFPILAPDGTAAAPQYAFSTSPTSGLYNAGSGVVGITRAGTSRYSFSDAAFDMLSTSAIIRFGGDAIIARDGAANTLAMRNLANAQTFRVYNTYTDASNYERGFVRWAANILEIGTEALGTGVTRNVSFNRGGSSFLGLVAGSVQAYTHLTFSPDNTYDIGASGATRPRSIYVGTNAIIGNACQVASGGYFSFASRGVIASSADGVFLLTNTAGTDFTRLQFGGTTSSFGAVGRDGAGVKIVGADGTSVSWIKVPGVTVANLPAAATAGAGARSFVTDALTPVFGSAVTGGGAVTVPVYSTGSAWNVG